MIIPNEVQGKYDLLNAKLVEMRQHSVFSKIQSLNDLSTFMQWHIFAVWDFMSLAKRLQIEFTTVSLPWMPPKHNEAARLVNEIISGEETDVLPTGQPMSHYEMYRIAMDEVGADPRTFDDFFNKVLEGKPVEEALDHPSIHPAIREFVTATIKTATTGTVAQVLGSFFYGREDSIPQMFSNFLKSWGINEAHAPTLVYYLKRHIELDGDSHGPAVQKIMTDSLNGNVGEWETLFDEALKAVELRIQLWDALASELVSAAA